MKLLSEKIVKDYLMPYLENKWLGMYGEASQYPDRRFPFVIEEAVLNTALTGSIFRYMHDNNDYTSTLVSEAGVKRHGTGKGRCDIIWYSGDAVYYIELKNVFLYGTVEASVEAAKKYVDEAVNQIYSIVSESMAKNTVTENERWYGFVPKRRYGFVGGLLFSEENKKSNSFEKYNILLNNSELSIRPGISLKPFGQQFAKCPLNISYYSDDGQKTPVESDGYFFLCAEFEIL